MPNPQGSGTWGLLAYLGLVETQSTDLRAIFVDYQEHAREIMTSKMKRTKIIPILENAPPTTGPQLAPATG